MNYRIPTCILAALSAAALVQAAPSDDAQAAAKKLADAANYSWKTTTQNAANAGGGGRGGFGGGPISGVAEKGGVAVITRETQNGNFQTVTKGDQVVIQTQNGWMTADEMRAQFQNGGGGGRGRGGFGFFGGNQAPPAQQLTELLAGASDFKAADGAITATLSAEAAAPLIARGGRGGQAAAGPQNVSGTLKLWVQNGVVSKYEVHITGRVQGRNGEQQVDRTTTTEITNVGSTKVEVPAEAQAKLGA